MFFSISKTNKDPRFCSHRHINKYNVHLDSGWEERKVNEYTVFFKGYCDTNSLEQLLYQFIDDNTPKYSGNFCIIIISDKNLTITHDINRSFPLKYYDNDILTNLLYNEDSVKINDNVWVDSFITYDDSGISKTYLKNLYSIKNFEKISAIDCVDTIKTILTNKVEQLNQISKSVDIFLSGGIDTTMVYSLLKNKYKYPESINIIAKEEFEFSEFTVNNLEVLMNHSNLWGYKLFHHWKKSTVYATGGMGDEIFMRGPTTAAIWCAWNNINLLGELKKIEYSYHKNYFLLEKNRKIIEFYWNNKDNLKKQFPEYTDLCSEIINMVLNDHQHWHLENTISWTPLKDMRILKTILSLDENDILKQIIHGSIDKEIISQLYPGMEHYICTHKNYNQYDNLRYYKPFLEKLSNA